VLGRQARVVEVVEQPELFFEQERAVQRLVGLLDFPELGELVDRLFLRRLQGFGASRYSLSSQRPSGLGALPYSPKTNGGSPRRATGSRDLTGA